MVNARIFLVNARIFLVNGSYRVKKHEKNPVYDYKKTKKLNE